MVAEHPAPRPPVQHGVNSLKQSTNVFVINMIGLDVSQPKYANFKRSRVTNSFKQMFLQEVNALIPWLAN